MVHRLIISLLLLVSVCFNVGAQTMQTYAPKPPLDCSYSLHVCSSSAPIIQTRTLNYSGAGEVPNEIDAQNTCLKTGDNHGFWYDFYVNRSGELVFYIQPRNNPSIDYNWILFRSNSGNCADLTPVLCNFSRTPGLTGTDDQETVSGDQDANGQPIVKSVRVLAGNRYYLYISSPVPNPPGYELSFQGTSAGFGTTAFPRLDRIDNQSFQCGERRLFIRFNRQIARLSLQETDLELISPTNQTIAIAQIVNPPNDASSNEYNFEIQTAVPLTETGLYRLKVKDRITDVCNNEVARDEIAFSIERLELPLEAFGDRTICAGALDSVQLSARVSMPNLPDIQYEWQPNIGLSNNRSSNPRAYVTQTTTYTVIARSGDCVSLPDTVRIAVVDPNQARIQGKTNACTGETVTLRGIGAERFFWVELNQTAPEVNVRPTGQATYTAIPSSGNCTGNPIRFTINTAPRPNASFNAPSALCTEEIFTVEYTGINDGAFRRFEFDSSAFIISGSRLGTYELFFTSPGMKVIRLFASANGCENTFSRIIDVTAIPEVNAGETVFRCADDGVEIPATINDATGCIFSWSPTAGLSNPNILRPFARPARTTLYTLTATCPCGTVEDTVSVVMNPVISANARRNIVSYCEGSQGALLRTEVIGGTGRYVFEWFPKEGLDEPAAQNPFAKVNTTTTYTLFAKDEKGCQAKPVTITVVPQKIPIADAGGGTLPKRICAEGPGVDLVGQAYGDVANDTSYLFSWQPAEGLANPNAQVIYVRPAQTTIYTLTVTNKATGCSSVNRPEDKRSTVVVEVLPRPQADAGPDQTTCVGTGVRLGDVPWDLDSNYVYSWQPDDGTLNDLKARRPIATPRVSTTYSLTLVSANCTAVDTVRVNVIPAPDPYVAFNYVDVCPGNSVKLTAHSGITTADSALVRYIWSPEEGLDSAFIAAPTCTPKKTTVYTVTAMFKNCQERSDTVRVNVVNAPSVIADNNFREGFIICRGDTFTIPAKYQGEEPFDVYWVAPDMQPEVSRIITPDARQPKVAPTVTTRYFVTLMRSGCSFLDSVDVKVVPAINPVIVSRDTMCSGDSLQITVTGGTPFTKFTWNPPTYVNVPTGRTVTIFPPYTQTIEVIAEDAGCRQVARKKITVIPTPKAKFEFNIERACLDYRVHFTDQSDSAVFNIWDFGDGTEIVNGKNPTHVYTTPGTYTVKMRALFYYPCEKEVEATRTITLYPRGTTNIGIAPNDTVMLPFSEVRFRDSSQNVASRRWIIGDESYAGDSSFEYRFLRAGRYLVRLIATDSGGCVIRDSVWITVLEPKMDITNVFTPNNDGINDVWSVKYTGQEKYIINIFDRWGQIVFTSENPQEEWNGKNKNSGSDCATGTYFFQMKVGEKIYRGNITLLR
jgi:gliding motility-associated-like protein